MVGRHVAGASDLAPGSSRPSYRREPLYNYEHKKLIEAIARLDEVPSDSQGFSEWIKAEAHLAFLSQNALADELIIYASGEYTFVHSVAVPNDRLSPVDRDDLMSWNFNPYVSIASYVTHLTQGILSGEQRSRRRPRCTGRIASFDYIPLRRTPLTPCPPRSGRSDSGDGALGGDADSA